MRSWNSIALCCGWMAACVFSLSAQNRPSAIPPSQVLTKPTKQPQLLSRPAPVARPAVLPNAGVPPPVPKIAVLAAGLPLRIQLDKRYRMRKGKSITGRLIDPVYSGDNIVLPKNTVIFGTISNLRSLQNSQRTWALLDGDVTPLKTPVLVFNALQLPGGERVALTADATERTAKIVKMGGPQPKRSLFGKLKAQIDAKKNSIKGIFHAHHKSDMALKFIYAQLPYHPQDIWAGTQFDAVLTQPLTVPDPNAQRPLPLTPPLGHIPPGTLDARLITTLSSATNKVGDPVAAVLTHPYFNANKTDVILPTGTQLNGVVTQAKPARKFSRNGALRFTFRHVELPNGALEQMHGQLTAVEGISGQNVTVDSEGGAKANSDQGQLLAPMLLGAMAATSLGDSQDSVSSGAASNGFGLVTRIAAFIVVNPGVTATFAYYSLGKSVTRRWLMPGHNVVFAENTRMELAVADR